ncbi:NAD(P)-binding domain [Trinorchestia longiramus]|nr:NAD(P)-binding domain [Trinorchestia longiramus]
MYASVKPVLATATYCRHMSQAVQKLSGKVAIVTGSTEGIGFAIAQRMAEDGAKVIVSSRKSDNVERAVQELHDKGLKDTFGIPCHVGKEGDRINLIEKTVEKFGGLDVFVANAATNPAKGDIFEVTESQWDKIFDVNLKAPWALTKLAVPHMLKKKGGSIIYISSVAAYHGMEYPVPLMSTYSVSKSGMLGLAKAVLFSKAKDNIRVNCVLPGVIKTTFGGVLIEDEAVHSNVMRATPMKRLGKPDDIAGITSFLASDDASFINGESIIVSGGLCARF